MNPSITLLNACRDNDRKAQRELYELCFSGLIKVCWRYARSKSEAIDHYNLGFVHIIQKLSGYNPELPFGNWAKRVIVNYLIDEYRKRMRLEKNISYIEEQDLARLQDTDKSANEQDAMNSAHIMAAIQELPEKWRIVLNMFAIEGYSHEEIAAQLDITVGTSRVYLARAREELKNKLSNEYRLKSS